MLTQVKVEKVAKIKQWDLKGRYCTPEQFETKAISHVRQLDANIANPIECTLVRVMVPIPVNATAPTADETAAIDKATDDNKVYDEANAKLRDFLVSSLEGQPHNTIITMGVMGKEKTDKELWNLLMRHYKIEEVTTLESMLKHLKINVYDDMENQIAKFENLVGLIALHKDGGAKTDKELMIKLMSKFPKMKAHYYTETLARLNHIMVKGKPLTYADFKDEIMTV
jgi:hypothetical protein